MLKGLSGGGRDRHRRRHELLRQLVGRIGRYLQDFHRAGHVPVHVHQPVEGQLQGLPRSGGHRAGGFNAIVLEEGVLRPIGPIGRAAAGIGGVGGRCRSGSIRRQSKSVGSVHRDGPRLIGHRVIGVRVAHDAGNENLVAIGETVIVGGNYDGAVSGTGDGLAAGVHELGSRVGLIAPLGKAAV